MKKAVVNLFPTPIHIFNYENHPALIKCKSELSGIFTDEQCITTSDDLHLNKPFAELSDIILQSAKEVFDEYKLVRDGEYITCMWANISDSTNKHMMHVHANSFWSGVLHLNCPQPNPGVIEFRDPRYASHMQFFEYEDQNTFSMRTAQIVPEDGMLILFPSWLEHGVQPGEFSKYQRRISLSFNIMPKCNVSDFSHQYRYI